MQTLQQLLDKYAESHQNKTNKIIHYFCVPAIFFSVIGLLMSIPSNLIKDLTGMGSKFEAPKKYDFIIDTSERNEKDTLALLTNFIKTNQQA